MFSLFKPTIKFLFLFKKSEDKYCCLSKPPFYSDRLQRFNSHYITLPALICADSLMDDVQLNRSTSLVSEQHSSKKNWVVVVWCGSFVLTNEQTKTAGTNDTANGNTAESWLHSGQDKDPLHRWKNQTRLVLSRAWRLVCASRIYITKTRCACFSFVHDCTAIGRPV